MLGNLGKCGICGSLNWNGLLLAFDLPLDGELLLLGPFDACLGFLFFFVWGLRFCGLAKLGILRNGSLNAGLFTTDVGFLGLPIVGFIFGFVVYLDPISGVVLKTLPSSDESKCDAVSKLALKSFLGKSLGKSNTSLLGANCDNWL